MVWLSELWKLLFAGGQPGKLTYLVKILAKHWEPDWLPASQGKWKIHMTLHINTQNYLHYELLELVVIDSANTNKVSSHAGSLESKTIILKLAINSYILYCTT